jgi:hypothetical protein
MGEATDGSDQETHIGSEGSPDAEAPRGGTQGSGNPQAKGDRRQGSSHTEEEQGLGATKTRPLSRLTLAYTLRNGDALGTR